MKLNLGCGSEILQGYINCDLYAPNVDLKMDADKIDMADNTVEEIRAYHLIEHFDFKKSFQVVREWHRVLKPGGLLRLETPDFLNSCRRFVEGDENTRISLYGHLFSMPWVDGLVHKFLYTEAQLGYLLRSCGFIDINRNPPDSSYFKEKRDNPDLYLNVTAKKAP